MLSIITITHNEARNMPEFLKGVGLLQSLLGGCELIIIDSGSTDQTCVMVEKFCAQNPSIALKLIEQKNWQGFGYQKNFALAQASGDWVLSLDADEYLNQNLATEIAKIVKIIKNAKNIENSQNINHLALYALKRQNYFCGKKIQYSGWQRDIVLRLWQRHPSIRFSDDVVHERVIYQNEQNEQNEQSEYIKYIENTCKHRLNHYPYQNFEDVLRKIQNYSSLGAQKIQQKQLQKNKKNSFLKAFGHGFWSFVKTFILQKGVLDGQAGFNIALMNGLASYYKYLKAGV